MYDFRVIAVHKVVDGDTADLFLDVGFRATLRQRIRLAVVDTPERRAPGYETAKLFLADWMRERPGNLRLTSYSEDTLARWVGDIYDQRNGETVSEALLEAGLAVVWKPR